MVLTKINELLESLQTEIKVLYAENEALKITNKLLEKGVEKDYLNKIKAGVILKSFKSFK